MPLRDWLFPLSCIGCGAPDVVLCEDCSVLCWRPLPQHCPLCEEHPALGGMLCRHCTRKTRLHGLVTATPYDNPIVTAALNALKQKGVSALIPALARLCTEALAESHAPLGEEPVVTPVPLHPRRLRERGFDQSALLTESIAETMQLRSTNLLQRRRYTPSQQGQPRKRRLQQLHEAFVVREQAPINPPPVLLVDDVVTTGATLEEAARTLHNAGWKTIWGMAVARA